MTNKNKYPNIFAKKGITWHRNKNFFVFRYFSAARKMLSAEPASNHLSCDSLYE